MSSRESAGDDRVLTFELAGSAHALPITGVVEVIEIHSIAFVPSLPVAIGGVINHHGDALPLIHPTAILELPESPSSAPEQALVISDHPAAPGRMALPVDRVVGLASHPVTTPALAGDPVVERRAIDGRVTAVLDPKQLVERAAGVIERSAGGSPAGHGGE